MNREETVDQIGIIAKAMMTRCDEIAGYGTDRKVCNMFLPREARKRVDLVLAFIAVLAKASSMAPIADAHPVLADLQHHLQTANVVVANRLPVTCRNLITCISSGGSGFRPRDLLRAIIRLPWYSRHADFADSVYRLCRRPRVTTRTAADRFRSAESHSAKSVS